MPISFALYLGCRRVSQESNRIIHFTCHTDERKLKHHTDNILSRVQKELPLTVLELWENIQANKRTYRTNWEPRFSQVGQQTLNNSCVQDLNNGWVSTRCHWDIPADLSWIWKNTSSEGDNYSMVEQSLCLLNTLHVAKALFGAQPN